MFFELNKVLLSNSGASGSLLAITERSEESDLELNGFFTPFESSADFFHRAICVFTAPLCLSILFVEKLIASVVFGAFVAANLVLLEPEAAFDSFLSAATCVMESPLVLLVAAVSPVLNAVDLAVSTAFSCV
ncbi:hypothetical protein [Legionella shakespearei]|uniref:Uncharacterized protein n=1 Tax=Legionella shakespearei DSM 23087 TaxID=1122169 RepID=A0A0W0Z109_9GAMM|nr:hypothetical protein [Legionella shakespearei]KTD62791.1 hypothetical protein Lsha_0823 [Legionella shakespearei DSM 23087]